MDSEARDLLGEIERIREAARRVVRKAGDRGIVWKPGLSDTNSIAVIVTHMCGSESQWIHKYVGGAQIDRKRELEFNKPISTAAGLLEALDKSAAATKKAMEAQTSQSLSRAVATHNPEIAKTARDCVLHSISHNSTHIGHLELTLQMWENSTR